MAMQTKYFITLFFTTVIITAAPAQNVGIGTPATTRAKLELHGMHGNTNAIFGSEGNGMAMVSNVPLLGFNTYYNGGQLYIGNGYALSQYINHETGYMYFHAYGTGTKDLLITNPKLALTIAPNGRVRIGENASFDATIDVARDPGRDATAYFSAPQFTAFNYGPAEHTYIRGATAPGKIFLNFYPANSKVSIGGGGASFGINWGDPVYPLEIHAPDFGLGLMRMGSANHWLFVINFNYLKFFFRASTDNNTFSQLGIFSYTNGQYSAASDRRMKKQIEPLPPMLEKLMQLQVYRYQMKYNNPNHDETFGLIAQEVQPVFPGLVHVTKNASTGYKDISDVYTLAYSGLAPIVLKALQEQQAQLEKLEERTARLENR